MGPGKTWHLIAAEDGEAVIRVNGKRYPVILTKAEGEEAEAALAARKAKYPPPPGGGEGSWFFRIASRK